MSIFAKYLGGQASGGGGNVVGPGSSVAGTVPVFADTTGKLLEDTPVTIDADGNVVARSLYLTNPDPLSFNSYSIVGLVPPASALFTAITGNENELSNGFSICGYSDANLNPLTFFAVTGGWADIAGDFSMTGFIDVGDVDNFFGMAIGPSLTDTVTPGDILWYGNYPADGVALMRFNAGGGIDILHGKLTAVGGIGVGNSAVATTPGTVTRKIEVFDASGASLGFVPVYDAIT